MKKNLYKCVLLTSVILLLIFCSCNKSTNNNYNLPTGEYVFKRLGDFSTIRMFTKNGEISDSSIINKYTIIYDSLIYPHNKTRHPIDTFNILDNNLAIHFYKLPIYYPPYLLTNPRDTICSNFTITPIDNYYKFQGIDTLKFNGYLSTSEFSFQKYKFYSGMKSFPPPFSGPNYTVVSTFNYFISYYNAGYLIFPEINFIEFYHRNSSSMQSSYLSYGSVNNIFEIKNIDKMPADDTLIFQTYNLYYLK